MQRTFKAGQANAQYMDLVAKASGDAIVSGTVNFYLLAISGDNEGRWFRASDSTWQLSESSAGEATYKGGSAWKLTIAAAAWISGVDYMIYAKESGNLSIVYNPYIQDEAKGLLLTGITAGNTWTLAKAIKVIVAWNLGNWQLKTGEDDVYEIIDPDDGTTVIAEMTASPTSPYKQVTIL